jgi:hypothetical protein
LTIIAHLGDKLASLISISAPAARGLIKLAIKDEFGPFRQHPQINFEEYKSILENSLRKRLKNLNVPDVNNAINQMLDELTLKQSLITMEAL